VAYTLQFVFNENIDHAIEMGEVPIPPVRADVEIAGAHYTVDHVAIIYNTRVEDAVETHATAWLSTHPELG
jgi:hypothetical protein